MKVTLILTIMSVNYQGAYKMRGKFNDLDLTSKIATIVLNFVFVAIALS